MAIKKRTRRVIDNAAIESFGAAAEAPRGDVGPTPPSTRTEVEQDVSRSHAPSGSPIDPAAPVVDPWPEGLAKSFLLRFPDPSIPLHIEELRHLIGRNKHQTFLLALRRGIDALRAEAEQMGERADLIK